MKPQALAPLTFRIVVLVPFVYFACALVWGFFILWGRWVIDPARSIDWSDFLTGLGVYAALSLPLILLWAFAPWLAKRTVPDTDEEGNDASSARLVPDLLAVALCVVGLVTLWVGLTELPSLGRGLYTASGNLTGDLRAMQVRGLWQMGVRISLRCGIGLALVFGARRLVGAMTWLRPARSASAAETTRH